MEDKPTNFSFDESFEKFIEFGRYESNSNLHVAIYGEKPNHTFTYVIYSWDLSEYEFIGEGFWCCCSNGGIFSDLATAKSEAKRELGLVSN